MDATEDLLRRLALGAATPSLREVIEQATAAGAPKGERTSADSGAARRER